MSRVRNVAFYQFVELENPESWKETFSTLKEFGVKGTLLIAKEGMNGFLAGSEPAIEQSLQLIRDQSPFASLIVKDSFSDFNPYKRFLIKVKNEIVTFRQECTPNDPRAKRISAAELARWYEEGESFHIIDTRNDFEFRLGAFEGAECLGIKHFVNFAERVKTLPEEWKKQKIVTYCTGGIRCEKAAPYMAEQGFEQVYQLDGGILKYFELMGGKHWRGDCFVFDHRVALNPQLQPSGLVLCEVCQNPIEYPSAPCIHCEK